MNRPVHSAAAARIAVFLLLLGLAGLRREAPVQAMEPSWLSVGGGVEWIDHLDADPLFYRDAHGRSKNAWLSAGRGQRVWFAAGWERIDVEQASWNWAATRWAGAGGLRLAGDPASPLRLEGGGYRESAGQAPSSWGLSLGPSLVRTGADSRHTLRLRLGLVRQTVLDLGPDKPLRIRQGELAWLRDSGWRRRTLALLASSRSGVLGTALLARWERRPATGLGLKLDALVSDGLEGWTDLDRLVMHNGPQALRATVSAGLGWRFRGGLGLELKAGWEKLQFHEARWLWAGLSWNRVTWRLD